MRTRSRIARFSALAIAAFAFVLAPGAAFAGHKDNKQRKQGNYYDNHGYQYGRVNDRGHRGHRGHRGYGGARVYQHGAPCESQYYRSDYRQERYFCQPCNHYFDTRPNFHSHLNRHHHIPLWKIPFVIVHSTFGWIFHGGHHY